MTHATDTMFPVTPTSWHGLGAALPAREAPPETLTDAEAEALLRALPDDDGEDDEDF